jgi:putative transposase
LDKEVRDLEKARTCVFQANYHLIWATKYRRKVLLGSVEVRLEEVLKMIADQSGYQLFAARVHHGDHVHVFVSAPPRVSIPKMVSVFKCNSARLLFEEFSELKLRLWGGHLWSEGYAVRTAGVVTSAKIEEYINRA